ncbi:MAG: hypothetical protein ACREAC_08015, partial [Blastocatellia bacterium]
NPADLEVLSDRIAELRARRNASVLSLDESELFAAINRTLPDEDQERLAILRQRREDEALSPVEHTELLDLQHKLESLHTARMRALAGLASLRGLTLTEVMEQLGIQFPDHE